ncbi:hypothetical protein C3B51_23030, partial [Pseudoalteromonas rubra]
NMTLTVLKISHLEQLNSKIFAWLSNIFSRLKIEHLIKQIGITRKGAEPGAGCVYPVQHWTALMGR